ncbi:Transmembrane and coiled-coil domain-containing protein 7, partial [Stegodyphus mimosarum]
MLHTYLIGAKHEDPRIRSSSLSNLGEACIYLKFNIEGHWLQEILVCVLALLKTDKDLEVRRCAVMVITLLFRGIGNDLLKVLEKEIKSLYIQLKIVYSTEADDVLRLHSQLALEEINVVMKELLLTKLPLKKEIRILQ